MHTAGSANEETSGGYALPVTPTRTKRLLGCLFQTFAGRVRRPPFLLTINPARTGYRLMLGLDTVESVAHVIQVALTPVFLLSGIASLLGVLSTRLARVADRVDALAEQLEADGPIDRRKLRRRLTYLRRRSHVLDAAVMMGTLGGVATSCAALLLFVGTLRDRPGVSLFVAFGLALLFTMGALVAFLIEMLLASRGLRDQANCANEVGEMHELAAEGVGEPNSWRVGLGVSTREECSHFWPVHFSWRAGFPQNNRAENSHQSTWRRERKTQRFKSPGSAQASCLFTPPVTKSVYDIEIGFSSGLALGFALQRLAAERIRTPGLRLRRQIGVRHPEICINRRRLKRRNDWRLVRNRACVCTSARSRLTGGLTSAPIAA